MITLFYVEQYFMRALRIAEGNPMVLFSSRIGNILWVFLVLSLVAPPLIGWYEKRKAGHALL